MKSYINNQKKNQQNTKHNNKHPKAYTYAQQEETHQQKGVEQNSNQNDNRCNKLQKNKINVPVHTERQTNFKNQNHVPGANNFKNTKQ